MMNYCRRFLKYFFLSKKMHLKDPKVENYQSLDTTLLVYPAVFQFPGCPLPKPKSSHCSSSHSWGSLHGNMRAHAYSNTKQMEESQQQLCWPKSMHFSPGHPNMKWYFPPLLTVVKVNIINLAINHILLFVTSSTFCILVIKLTKYFTCLGLNK